MLQLSALHPSTRNFLAQEMEMTQDRKAAPYLIPCTICIPACSNPCSQQLDLEPARINIQQFANLWIYQALQAPLRTLHRPVRRNEGHQRRQILQQIGNPKLRLSLGKPSQRFVAEVGESCPGQCPNAPSASALRVLAFEPQSGQPQALEFRHFRPHTISNGRKEDALPNIFCRA